MPTSDMGIRKQYFISCNPNATWFSAIFFYFSSLFWYFFIFYWFYFPIFFLINIFLSVFNHLLRNFYFIFSTFFLSGGAKIFKYSTNQRPYMVGWFVFVTKDRPGRLPWEHEKEWQVKNNTFFKTNKNLPNEQILFIY